MNLGAIELSILLPALVAGLLVTATHVPLGTQVLARGIVFIDLAIAQGEELGVPMWVCQAARLVYKHAMFEGATDDDISTLVCHVESGAGFEMPKTR